MNRIEKNPFAQLNEQKNDVDLKASEGTTEGFSKDLANAIGVHSGVIDRLQPTECRAHR